MPLAFQFRVSFTHARKVRHVDIELGCLMIRLLDTHQVLWALVAHDPDCDRNLVLLTSIPVRTVAEAQAVCTEWRFRPQIEHTYRFSQEAGLDVEDTRVPTVERMRRVFVLVLLSGLFVYHVTYTWPQHMVL